MKKGVVIIIVKTNVLDSITYSEIRESANFRSYLSSDIDYALAHDLFDTVIYDKEKPIGIGRIIGDGKISFIIKDVVVLPEYQHLGIGDLIMKSLFDYIKKNAADGAYVGLMSTPGKEYFYEKYGFIRRPTKDYGSGMVLFYEQKK